MSLKTEFIKVDKIIIIITNIIVMIVIAITLIIVDMSAVSILNVSMENFH